MTDEGDGDPGDTSSAAELTPPMPPRFSVPVASQEPGPTTQFTPPPPPPNQGSASVATPAPSTPQGTSDGAKRSSQAGIDDDALMGSPQRKISRVLAENDLDGSRSAPYRGPLTPGQMRFISPSFNSGRSDASNATPMTDRQNLEAQTASNDQLTPLVGTQEQENQQEHYGK